MWKKMWTTHNFCEVKLGPINVTLWQANVTWAFFSHFESNVRLPLKGSRRPPYIPQNFLGKSSDSWKFLIATSEVAN